MSKSNRLLCKGSVYFITGEADDYPIKIGVARNDVEQRLSALQTASPFRLRVIGTISSTNPYGLESLLHGMFDSQRLAGEWFSRSQELLAFIENPDEDVLNSVPVFPCLPDPPPPPLIEPVFLPPPLPVRVELIYSPDKRQFVHPDELTKQPPRKCEKCRCCDVAKHDGRLCLSCLNLWTGRRNPCELKKYRARFELEPFHNRSGEGDDNNPSWDNAIRSMEDG